MHGARVIKNGNSLSKNDLQSTVIHVRVSTTLWFSKKSQVQLTTSVQLDIDPLMNACTLLILLWQCYKHGIERERERERICAVKYSATFLVCFVLGIFKLLISSFHPLGDICTTEHVNFWKNTHFLMLTSSEIVISRCEQAKIRFKDCFSNRLYLGWPWIKIMHREH